MEKTILNSFQIAVLNELKKNPLNSKFYLSGGTALSEYYLHHRFSEDLDFFTQEELVIEEIKKFIKSISRKNKIKKIEISHGFGLYTFFLTPEKTNIKYKIDFGQYPFPNINKLNEINGLRIESLFDIAVNKVHTIAFRPRLRDFIDVYFILQENKDWSFPYLLKKSFEKFEMRADALQISQNLLLVKSLKDMPKMIKKIDLKKVESFFVNEIKNFEKDIWK